MRTVDIDEAQHDLSRLVDGAANGESFIIAKSGKPLVKVVPLDAPTTIDPPTDRKPKRFDFLAGQIQVPDDFDTMFAEEIERMFYGDDDT